MQPRHSRRCRSKAARGGSRQLLGSAQDSGLRCSLRVRSCWGGGSFAVRLPARVPARARVFGLGRTVLTAPGRRIARLPGSGPRSDSGAGRLTGGSRAGESKRGRPSGRPDTRLLRGPAPGIVGRLQRRLGGRRPFHAGARSAVVLPVGRRRTPARRALAPLLRARRRQRRPGRGCECDQHRRPDFRRRARPPRGESRSRRTGPPSPRNRQAGRRPLPHVPVRPPGQQAGSAAAVPDLQRDLVRPLHLDARRGRPTDGRQRPRGPIESRRLGHARLQRRAPPRNRSTGLHLHGHCARRAHLQPEGADQPRRSRPQLRHAARRAAAHVPRGRRSVGDLRRGRHAHRPARGQLPGSGRDDGHGDERARLGLRRSSRSLAGACRQRTAGRR